MATYVVTGGAGFIGSNIVFALEAQGHDVVVIDKLGSGDKWRNLSKRRLAGLAHPNSTLSTLEGIKGPISAVFHLGAISSTTEIDSDLIVETNFRLSCKLWDWCARRETPFIYASSAATYGNGANGFLDRDDATHLASLRPLNPYGWSKHLFDRWACDRRDRADLPDPPRWAGLKFFNVYGPNEYHKGGQRSMAVQMFDQITDGGRVQLYHSYDPSYADGAQRRDFIWVKDCVEIALWFANEPRTNGLYNVGTGEAHSFIELADAVYSAIKRPPQINYISMPKNLRARYQYFTEADTSKLAAAGYKNRLMPFSDAVHQYVGNYLMAEDPYV